MKKLRENKTIILPTRSFATAELSKKLLLSKHNYLECILKTNWENFLSTYQYSKKKQSKGLTHLTDCKQYIGSQLEKKYPRDMLLESPKVDEGAGEGATKEPVYFKKEKFWNHNYFILAKLVDLLGNTPTGLNRVRKLIKTNNKFLELEKLFRITVPKNSLFFSWISYLLMGLIYHFIKMISSFLYKSKIFSTLGPVWEKKNKLEIQNNGNVLFLKCQDFLFLKWYQNRIHAWADRAGLENKEIILNQNDNIILDNRNMTSFLEKDDKLISYLQDERSSTQQKLMRTKCFEEKMPKPEGLAPLAPEGVFLDTNCPKVPKVRQAKRYLRLIRKILQKSKVTTQVKLIQKLNQILGNWDTFVINKITKKESLKLNLILYQLLWRWGLARHRKQKAKWIKNRYWFDSKNSLF